MAQNISPRRGAAIAGSAALVLLVAVAAFDNQWLDHWRAGRGADGGDSTHSWFAGAVKGLSALGWRATKESGEPSRVYFAMMAEPLIAVLLTFLLVLLVCRGVTAERGRWSLFLGSWFVTGLAAAMALLAGSAIGGTGVAGGTADPTGSTYFSRGEIYYTLIAMGLAFGLFAGWLVGFVAVLVYGSTEGSDDDRAGSTREYPSPAIDYSDYSPSSAASAGLPSANEDYSFAPTSPYSSSGPSSPASPSSESAGYGGYASANAPTEMTSPASKENDPYGGARPY
jgi:hypothetical protein